MEVGLVEPTRLKPSLGCRQNAGPVAANAVLASWPTFSRLVSRAIPAWPYR